MVAQSMEINNALVLLAAIGGMALFGGRIFRVLSGSLTECLGNLGARRMTCQTAVTLATESISTVISAGLPLMLFVGAMGLLGSLAQTGVLMTPNKIKPDLNHINPVNGLKNLFSLSALMRLVMALMKLVAISLIAFFLLRDRVGWLYSLSGKTVWGILDATRSLCLSLVGRITGAMVAVAVLDFAFQRWQFGKKIMMSKSELKEEHKRDEGDPEVRGRQAQMRRSISRARMMQAVPKADVVVTNPDHVAVALRWDEAEMSAPKVVAKGKNYLAQRIKAIARQHNVPVLERKLLARTLYEVVEVGNEIPPKLYYVVAEVLAFVMRKRRKRA